MATNFYENFEKAQQKLSEFVEAFDGSEMHMAAIIQAFEFTFEQCWKAIQKRATGEGAQVASPKKAFEWAMSAGWIDSADESLWLRMVDDRNLSSHTYRETVAAEVSERILESYVVLFEKILGQMKAYE